MDIFFIVAILVLGYKATFPNCGHKCPPPESEVGPRVLTVREIRVVDKEGKLRLTLGEGMPQSRWTTHTDTDTTYGLFLRGHDGRPTGAFVSETTIGGAEIQLTGFGPNQVATLVSTVDGDVGLLLQRKNALARVEVYGDSETNDTATLSLSRLGGSVHSFAGEKGPYLQLTKDSKTVWEAVKYTD